MSGGVPETGVLRAVVVALLVALPGPNVSNADESVRPVPQVVTAADEVPPEMAEPFDVSRRDDGMQSKTGYQEIALRALGSPELWLTWLDEQDAIPLEDGATAPGHNPRRAAELAACAAALVKSGSTEWREVASRALQTCALTGVAPAAEALRDPARGSEHGMDPFLMLFYSQALLDLGDGAPEAASEAMASALQVILSRFPAQENHNRTAMTVAALATGGSAVGDELGDQAMDVARSWLREAAAFPTQEDASGYNTWSWMGLAGAAEATHFLALFESPVWLAHLREARDMVSPAGVYPHYGDAAPGWGWVGTVALLELASSVTRDGSYRAAASRLLGHYAAGMEKRPPASRVKDAQTHLPWFLLRAAEWCDESIEPLGAAPGPGAGDTGAHIVLTGPGEEPLFAVVSKSGTRYHGHFDPMGITFLAKGRTMLLRDSTYGGRAAVFHNIPIALPGRHRDFPGMFMKFLEDQEIARYARDALTRVVYGGERPGATIEVRTYTQWHHQLLSHGMVADTVRAVRLLDDRAMLVADRFSALQPATCAELYYGEELIEEGKLDGVFYYRVLTDRSSAREYDLLLLFRPEAGAREAGAWCGSFEMPEFPPGPSQQAAEPRGTDRLIVYQACLHEPGWPRGIRHYEKVGWPEWDFSPSRGYAYIRQPRHLVTLLVAVGKDEPTQTYLDQYQPYLDPPYGGLRLLAEPE